MCIRDRPHTAAVVPGYSGASSAGQQQIAAQGATVDIGDAVMTNNLQVLGTIRANQAARQADIANLEAATQSQDAVSYTHLLFSPTSRRQWTNTRALT